MTRNSVLSDEEFRKTILDNVLYNELLTGQGVEYTEYQAQKMGLESPLKLFEQCYLVVSGIERAAYRRFGVDARRYSEMHHQIWKKLKQSITDMGYNSRYVMQIYDDTKRLVYVLSPMQNRECAPIARVAEYIHACIQQTCDQNFLRGNTMFSNFTVYDDAVNDGNIARRFESLCNLHQMTFFQPPKKILTREILDELRRSVEQSEIQQDVRDLFIHIHNADLANSMYLLRGTIFSKLSGSYDRVLCHRTTSLIISRLIEADQVFDLGMEEELRALDPRKIPSIALLEQKIESFVCNVVEAIAKTKHHYGPLTRSTILYIRQHYKENIGLQELADRSGVTPTYLSRLFNRDIGMSIPAYILTLRMDSIKRELEKTNQSIAQIALKHGFSSASYFGKRFRLEVGMSPQEFRDQKRNAQK